MDILVSMLGFYQNKFSNFLAIFKLKIILFIIYKIITEQKVDR
jgi:hypothetical protein